MSIGVDVNRRIHTAIGPGADPRILDGALLLFIGALPRAGLGFFTFGEVVRRIGAIVELWDES